MNTPPRRINTPYRRALTAKNATIALLIGLSLFGAERSDAAKTAIRLNNKKESLDYYKNSPDSYPVCKEKIDFVHMGNPRASINFFDTKTAFVEHGAYLKTDVGYVKGGTSLNNFITSLKSHENGGYEIYGTFVYREEWLKVDVNPDAVGGPFEKDRRILSQVDIDNIKEAIAGSTLRSKNSMKLFQLLGGRELGQKGDSWLKLNTEERNYLKQFDGIGIECHTVDANSIRGRNTLKATADLARWTRDQGMECLVFMGGGGASYMDAAQHEKTFNYLFDEMEKVGVDPRSDHIIYLRQGAHAAVASFDDHVPESDSRKLTYQVKWMIEQVEALATASTLTSPASGSTLSGSSATFTWTETSGIYWIDVGTSFDGYDLARSGQMSNTSHTFYNLPTDGRTLHVRLCTWVDGAWVVNNYTYTAKSGNNNTQQKAAILSPASGSTLPGSSASFQWTATTGIYWIDVGSSFDGYDLARSGQMSNTSHTFNNLPTDGRTLHVRLCTWVNGAWMVNNYTYKAASSVSQKNYVMNGGFESGMDYWSSWLYGEAGFVQTNHPFEGSRNLAHWKNSPYQVQTLQNVTGLPNGTYKATVWAKSTGGQAACVFYAYGYDYYNHFKQIAISPTSTYRKYEINNIPVQNGKCSISVYSDAPGGKWATFDNFTLTPQ